jgi:hypothetical protein
MICEGDTVKVYDSEKVSKIYMGKDGCRCGCEGEYAYPGDSKFERRLEMFQKKFWESTPETRDVELGEYIDVSYGNNRAITVYFK